MINNPYVSSRNMQQPQRIITVTGVGDVAVEPDQASVKLSVLTENTELTNAQRENAGTMEKVIQSLTNLGVPEENIRTVSFSIHPRYDYVDGEQVFRVYEVTHSIMVKVMNFTEIGKLIDVSVANGVNQVGDIAFSRSDRQQFEQRALQNALEHAQAKAQAMIEIMHVPFNPVPIKITEQNHDSSIPIQPFSLAEDVTTTPIEPGQLVITAFLQVEYEY